MKLSNSYANLGNSFSEKVLPAKVKRPELFLWNDELAEELSVDQFLDINNDELAEFFSGNRLLPGSEPIAMAYAGHQFGNFVPQLGDGRAHLLGELSDHLGNPKDIQLKGSGQTRFSRNGDGRCALGPAIREFIMSEAMHALNIPTTRCLAVTTTGEEVYRESIQPGAVVTRIASSHLRVGTFEYFAARRDYASIETLSDFAISRHYPELQDAGDERFSRLLESVIERQAKLITQWLRVGFIHGVMNTDNTAISGETIDFGPCAMMGSYDLNTVFSSIDRQGRYAFGNQPTIAQWNMARFAETLVPLIDPDENKAIEIATALVNSFSDRFSELYFEMLGRKIGLHKLASGDDRLIRELLTLLEKHDEDYTIFFNRLTLSLTSSTAENKLLENFSDWLAQWKQRLALQSESLADIQSLMRHSNPLVIPRNHHMENVIATCIESGSPEAAENFLKVLKTPYSETPATLLFQDAPGDGDQGYKTFCGT